MELKKSVIKGITWTTLSNFGQQAIQFVITIILARLLTPKDFGVVGIASIFIGLAMVIEQLGIGAALVQRKNLDEKHWASAFWANIIMGMILCSLMIVLAPFIASYFKNPQVVSILRALSVTFILGSLKIVPGSQLTRELFFNKLACITISTLLISGLVSVTLAFLGYGVWSLVWGRIVEVLIGLALTWLTVSWWPSLHFSLKKFKELFSFGISVLGTNLLTYVQKNSDYFIIGKFLGAGPLGIYTMAYNLVTLPQRKLSTIITTVAFPAFSKIQDETEKIREGFFTMISSISFVTFPILAGLCAVAPEFVKVVLGDKWVSAIKPIQILCIPGALYSVGTTIGSVFYAKGRPDLELKCDLVSFGILLPSLLIGIRYGIIGVALAVTVSSIMSFFIFFGVLNRLIQTTFVQIFQALSGNIAISALMFACVSSIRLLMLKAKCPEISVLTISVLTGIVIYVIPSLGLKMASDRFCYPKNVLKDFIAAKRQIFQL